MSEMTLVELFCHGAAHRPAISEAGGLDLDGVGLCNAADAIGAGLAARGVEPGDRVASTLPPSAAFVAAFLGVSSIRAALAPLPDVADEPSARAALRHRGIRAILTPPNAPAGLRSAAHAQGITLATVAFDEHGAAMLDGEPVYDAHARVAEPADVAFVPPTGNPLTHEELVAAVHTGGSPVEETLPALDPTDPRDLITILVTLASGSRVVFGGALVHAA